MTIREFCVYMMDNTARELKQMEKEGDTDYKSILFKEQAKLDNAVLHLKEGVPLTLSSIEQLKEKFNINVNDDFYQDFIKYKLRSNLETISDLENENKMLSSIVNII